MIEKLAAWDFAMNRCYASSKEIRLKRSSPATDSRDLLLGEVVRMKSRGGTFAKALKLCTEQSDFIGFHGRPVILLH